MDGRVLPRTEQIAYPPAARSAAAEGLRRAAALAGLLAADLAGLAAGFALAWVLRVGLLPLLWPAYAIPAPAGFWANLWWMLAFGLVCLAYQGLHTRRLPFWREVKRLAKACLLTFLIILGVVTLGKKSGEVSRTVLVLACAFNLFTLPAARWLAKHFLWRLGLWARPVLVLGAGKTGELVARALTADRYLGYRIAGFLDDDPAKRGVRANGVYYPVLGGFRDSDRVMQATGARDLIVAAPGMEPKALVGLVNRLQRTAASVTVIPDLFGVPVMGAETDYYFDEQALALRVRNNLARPLNRFVKRVFDLVAGSLILVAVLPLMGLIALAVKLDSPGPVLYRQWRPGMAGRYFWCLKFRSMYVDAEARLAELLRTNPQARAEWHAHYKLVNDPRVTRVGRFIRRTSLDELPQIFNVLRGEMSLVGPRPMLEEELSRRGAFLQDYFLVRPGITGLWQVSGRSDTSYDQRLRLESAYVRNWSLWLDLTILARTVPALLRRRGAY